MDGDTTTQSTLRGDVGDVGKTPEDVAVGSEKCREGRDDDDKGRDDVEQGDNSVSASDGAYGGGQLGNGSGPSTDGVPGGETGGGGHMAVGGPDSQGEEGLTGRWPCGGDVEGSGGDFKSPAHSLHHLPRLPP